MTTTLAQHFLMVPLTLFSMAVPLPFGALGLSEEVGKQLFKLVGHPSGALAMMGFRRADVSRAADAACVYLWKLKEVRGLTASPHQLRGRWAHGAARQQGLGIRADERVHEPRTCWSPN